MLQNLQVEGREINQDYSYEWVIGNADLISIEKGIPIAEFTEQTQNRDQEMEFRILRRLTETQYSMQIWDDNYFINQLYHNENLYDFHPDILKLNRYGNIIPCIVKTYSWLIMSNSLLTNNNSYILYHSQTFNCQVEM